MSNTSLTSKVTQSRGWTLALGIAAAALAAILLIAYLVQYRSSVNDSTAPTPVLVAKNLIPKGTSGTVIAEKELFQAATLAKDDLKVGAISDPAYLNGRVAVGRHLPRPADHDRRPERGSDRCAPDAAHGTAARSGDLHRRHAGARGLRRERRPRRHLLRGAGRWRERARSADAERPRHASAGSPGRSCGFLRPRRRRSLSPRHRARSGSCFARRATRRIRPSAPSRRSSSRR